MSGDSTATVGTNEIVLDVLKEDDNLSVLNWKIPVENLKNNLTYTQGGWSITFSRNKMILKTESMSPAGSSSHSYDCSK